MDDSRRSSGEARSAGKLAGLYLRGHGFERDYKLARKWYLTAAKSGVAKAEYGLATIYAKGSGLRKIWSVRSPGTKRRPSTGRLRRSSNWRACSGRRPGRAPMRARLRNC